MKLSRRAIVLGAGAVVVAGLLASPVGRWARSQMMGQRAMLAFVKLVGSGNAQDIDVARSLCTAGYLERNPLRVSEGGGIVGLPRNIHRNYQVWREGADIYICPTDRVGPIYRLVKEGGGVEVRWAGGPPPGRRAIRGGGNPLSFPREHPALWHPFDSGTSPFALQSAKLEDFAQGRAWSYPIENAPSRRARNGPDRGAPRGHR